jgi:hypothetical protein
MAPHIIKHATAEHNLKKEKLVMGPRWVPDTKKDWPTYRQT